MQREDRPQPGRHVAAGESPNVSASERPAERTTLLLLLVVGALLRLPGIWQFDIWQDEIYSIFEARDLIHSPFGPGGMELRPLYFLLLHPVVEAWPQAIALLRFPSLVFGLLGIWATWQLARRTLGRHAALVAAGILTLLPLHINASQIIRYWSLIYLLGALFAAALIKAGETDSRRDHLYVLLWLLLGTLTHPTFAISALGMTLGAHLVSARGGLGFQWPTPAAWRFTWVPAGLLLFAFYLTLWLFFTTERLVGEAAGSAERLIPALAYNLSPAVVTATALGIVCLLSRHDASARRFGLMALLGTLFSVVTLIVGGFARFLPVSVLYVSGAYPLLLGCAGALVTCLGATPMYQRRAAAVLLLVLAAALAPSTVSQVRDGARFDYRPALARIRAEDPGGTVVLWPLVQVTWAAPELHGIELRSSSTTALFDSLSKTHDRFWVILSERRYGSVADEDGSKQHWLARHCSRALASGKARFDFEHYSTVLWDCAAAAAPPAGI
jgi:uncharacterized membrane protein